MIGYQKETKKSGVFTKINNVILAAIVPILIGDEHHAMCAAEELLDRGFLVPAIRYPTVPRGEARLRVAIMSAHRREDLSRAAQAIGNINRRHG